jgi:hypothetical protein
MRHGAFREIEGPRVTSPSLLKNGCWSGLRLKRTRDANLVCATFPDCTGVGRSNLFRATGLVLVVSRSLECSQCGLKGAIGAG